MYETRQIISKCENRQLKRKVPCRPSAGRTVAGYELVILAQIVIVPKNVMNRRPRRSLGTHSVCLLKCRSEVTTRTQNVIKCCMFRLCRNGEWWFANEIPKALAETRPVPLHSQFRIKSRGSKHGTLRNQFLNAWAGTSRSLIRLTPNEVNTGLCGISF